MSLKLNRWVARLPREWALGKEPKPCGSLTHLPDVLESLQRNVFLRATQA
jgi:hypothetical protein